MAFASWLFNLLIITILHCLIVRGRYVRVTEPKLNNLTEVEKKYAIALWDYNVTARVGRTGTIDDYQFFVPLTERLAGVTYVGHAARLRLVLERVRGGEAIRVGSVGGSITTGQGIGGSEHTYGALFVDWLNAALPPTRPGRTPQQQQQQAEPSAVRRALWGGGDAGGAASCRRVAKQSSPSFSASAAVDDGGAEADGSIGRRGRHAAVLQTQQQLQQQTVGGDGGLRREPDGVESAFRRHRKQRQPGQQQQQQQGAQQHQELEKEEGRRQRRQVLLGDSPLAPSRLMAALRQAVGQGGGPAVTVAARAAGSGPGVGSGGQAAVQRVLLSSGEVTRYADNRGSAGGGGGDGARLSLNERMGTRVVVRRVLEAAAGAGAGEQGSGGAGGDGGGEEATAAAAATQGRAGGDAAGGGTASGGGGGGAVADGGRGWSSYSSSHWATGRLRHQFIQGGIPGTTSSYMSSCVNHHLPPGVDLVFVEYACNDPARPSWTYSDPYRRAFERLLRKLLRLPSQPAVVVVNMYAHQAAQGRYYNNAERDFTELATYYSIPSVSLKAAVVPLAGPGSAGGSSSSSSASSSSIPLLPLPSIFNGGKHHPGRGAHVVVLEELITMCLDLLQSNARLRAIPSSSDPLRWQKERQQEQEEEGKGMDPGVAAVLVGVASRPLPAPLADGNYESVNSTCYIEHELKVLVVSATEGWRWTDEDRNKWGWVATQPGQKLRLQLNTQLEGHRSGTDTSARIIVQVAYLQSYANMGTVKVSCESGCECESVTIDAFDPRPVSVTTMHDIRVSQSRGCVLALATAGPGTSSPTKHAHEAADASRGNKFKLLGVVVGEEPGALEGTVTWVRDETHSLAQLTHNPTA